MSSLRAILFCWLAFDIQGFFFRFGPTSTFDTIRSHMSVGARLKLRVLLNLADNFHLNTSYAVHGPEADTLGVKFVSQSPTIRWLATWVVMGFFFLCSYFSNFTVNIKVDFTWQEKSLKYLALILATLFCRFS